MLSLHGLIHVAFPFGVHIFPLFCFVLAYGDAESSYVQLHHVLGYVHINIQVSDIAKEEICLCFCLKLTFDK